MQTVIARPASASATAVGFLAIVLWSALALLTALSGDMPPFELAALTFAVGGLLGSARSGYGVKYGDVRLLAAYAASVLSTLILGAAGVLPAAPALALACALIVAGAVVATRSG